MNATLMMRERFVLDEGAFVEVVIWRVPDAVRASQHAFKYRLALVINETCVMRYDNEAGKGDHKHIGNDEFSYRFTSVDRLIADFWRDVDQLRQTQT